jgi:hypothetical protein
MRDHMDRVLGQALEQEYKDLVTSTAPSSAGRPISASAGSQSRTIWVTVVVAVVVVLTAGLVIRVGQQSTRPAIAPSVSSTVLESATLLQKLPKQPYGHTLHTWSDGQKSDTSGPFTLTGSTAVIAGICTGGGAIVITDAHGSTHKLGCARQSVQQPFWRFNLGGDGKPTKETEPVHVRVEVSSGNPRYVVRLWAVDPRILDAGKVSVAATSTSVPKSLRTCTAKDIAATATLDWRSSRGSGVVTIASRAATDCGIRSWPSMRYVSADGQRVGPTQGLNNNGRSLDSSEGSLDRYGQFPPARLTAGGEAYLILDLVTEQQLEQEDAEQKALPTPTTGPSFPLTLCKPEPVTSIRLGIGDATVTVPAPASPAPAACRTSTRAFGVNPVVADRPTVR